MAKTTGTRIRGGPGYSKTKYGKGVEEKNPAPGTDTLWDMFNLLLDPTGSVFGMGGGTTDIPKNPPPPTEMSIPDQNMAVEQFAQTGDMAQQVSNWDPFKGMVPMIGEGQPTPGAPPMPTRGMTPPAPVAQPAAPMPMPGRPNVNDREQALIQNAQGAYGSMPIPEPNPAYRDDAQLQRFFQMLAGAM